MIFEGNAGIGKSEMAIAFLKSMKFEPNDPKSTTQDKQKTYYHITPTDITTIESTLLQAFNEGAVVIIDELNSLPLENILNKLLSGVNLEDKPAENPGFYVIATQNPASDDAYKNRFELSPALLSRLQRIQLKNYTPAELELIVDSITNDPKQTKEIMDAYTSAVDFGTANHLQPLPKARQVFSYANSVKKF